MKKKKKKDQEAFQVSSTGSPEKSSPQERLDFGFCFFLISQGVSLP